MNSPEALNTDGRVERMKNEDAWKRASSLYFSDREINQAEG